MTTKEENTVLKSFDRRWSSLKLSDSAPCIAFIKRSDLAKNSLPNINEIIEMVDEVELPILLSKITDSKYPVIRRYSDIDPLDLTVITMPSYKEIKNYHKKSKEELVDNIEIVEKRRRFNLRNAYSYGNASVLALSGLLFISLGLTLSIILKVLGG